MWNLAELSVLLHYELTGVKGSSKGYDLITLITDVGSTHNKRGLLFCQMITACTIEQDVGSSKK